MIHGGAVITSQKRRFPAADFRASDLPAAGTENPRRFRRSRPASLHGHPPVDSQDVTGDVSRLFRGEKGDRGGDVLG